VEAVDSSARCARRCKLLLSLTLTASCAAACQPSVVLPAAFRFEGLTPSAIAVVSERLGAPLTAADLQGIESVARQELDVAFRHTRLEFTDSRTPVYRVRVIPQLAGRLFPAAGESRSFGGSRGDGVVNFNTVALSAVAFAADITDRAALLQAIGRGVGRTAVHEFAHQILGPSEMDHTADRLTYEHGDLRAEHFFATLHWGPAAEPLQRRIGLTGGRR